MPRLSIIVPSYNYGRYLHETIGSILSQDYTDYELILVDDCSSDQSPEICQEYASQYAHIQCIQHSKNLGIYESLLTGLKQSSGAYLHYFSADDRYLPGFLSKSMSFFDTHPEAGFVCTDLGYFQDGSDDLDERHLLEGLTHPRFISREEIVNVFRTTAFWVPGASCIASRDLVLKYGPDIPQLENISDWYIFHKMALCEGVGYIPEVLTSMRVHDRTLTNRVKGSKKRRRATYRYLLRLLLQDRDLRQRFLDAGLLDFIFRDLKWKLYLNPGYSPYWFKQG
ncbi:MAG: Undecaprenyl-phosphate 4-deoxy-4-formamido-L-arabinose transferase [Chlamydiales bacterium]|nr:Undecaprenyl-phosphate 4-deoxy-4-formamido-L-arabinose transferase [Chlamydiales bacterium]